MTKFELLTSITDVKKFSRLAYDLISEKDPEQIEEFLSEKINQSGVEALKRIERRGRYPLCLKSKGCRYLSICSKIKKMKGRTHEWKRK